ncbi:MAG: aspartyl/asparaginyl beta-hydroxylase domain-containing protein [Acidobacteriota bacterium]|nr:aspartyl/asparaginyl beta-hydroxylase domain-containing protein [Acidobacteriota bacterium]
MKNSMNKEPVAIRLPRTYDVDRLVGDLQILRDVASAPQPGPYHKGEWTGIALHSIGGRDSVFPSAPGLDEYRETESLRRTPYFKYVLEDINCPKEVVRILFLPPQGHIKDHFDFHTSFQFGLLRLHIPIITHPDVVFIIDGERVTWAPGELWYGDFSRVHSVRNDSPIVRAHMVIDVQINEFLLGLFPEDFVMRRRAEGISMTRDSMPASDSELRRFICDFRIPGELMPMFVIGKPLSSLIKGAIAAVRVIDGKLTVLFNNEPAFHLERISSNVFSISGLPPGITLQFEEENDQMQQVVLDMKGLPGDLYSARLGMFQGPSIGKRRVPLQVLSGFPSAPGSLN